MVRDEFSLIEYADYLLKIFKSFQEFKGTNLAL